MLRGKEYSASVEDVQIWLLLEEHSPKLADVNHIHKHVEIFYCCSGELVFETSQNEKDPPIFLLHKGECLIVPAEYSHHLIKTSRDAQWYCFGFSIHYRKRRGVAALYSQVSALQKLQRMCVLHDQVWFGSTLKTIFEMDCGEDSCLPAIQFIVGLAQLVAKNKDTIMPNTSSMYWKDDGNPHFFAIEQAIANRYKEKLTNKVLAEELHISERQLSRIVLKRYGTTLHKVIIEKRLEVARRYLIRGNESLSEIAVKTGFPNATAFTKAFV